MNIESEVHMFYWNKDKLKVFELEQEVEFLRRRLDLQAQALEDAIDRTERIEKAPHDYRVDGTPRQRPGRRAGV
jgi:hypothetical protein